MYAISQEAFKKAATAAKRGLTISLEKTKGLGIEPSDMLSIQIAGSAIDVVKDFTYIPWK